MSPETTPPASPSASPAPDPTSNSAIPTPPPARRINPSRQWVGAFVPNWLLRRTEISHGAKLTYAILCQHFGTEKGGRQQVCNPGQDILALELGVSERTIREYLLELINNGLIAKKRLGLGRNDRYFFLHHPWMTERSADWRKDGTRPSLFIDPGHNEPPSNILKRQDSAALERSKTTAPDRNKQPTPERHPSAGAVRATLAAPCTEVDSEEVDPRNENHSKMPPTPPTGASVDEAASLLDFLNSCAGTTFPATKRTIALIKDRIADVDGDVAGIKRMIERQTSLWKDNADYQKYLRPETLFRDPKFGSYFGQRDLPVITKQATGPINIPAINSRLTAIQYELREMGDDQAPHLNPKRRELTSEQRKLRELIKCATTTQQ